MIVRELVTLLKLEVDDKKLKGFESSVKSLKSSIFDVQNLLAAGMAAALGSMVNRAREFGDELGATSAKIGISATDLDALRYVALQTDTSTEALTMGIGMMNRVLGQAQLGSKQAQKAIGQLGLSVKDLAGKETKEAFTTIVSRLSAIKSPALQAAAAQGVFGRGARELLPLIKAGGAALQSYIEQYAEMNPLTQDQIDALGEYDNTVNDLNVSIRNLSNLVAVSLLPIFKYLARVFTGWALTLGKIPKPLRDLLSLLTAIAFILPAIVVSMGLFGQAVNVIKAGLILMNPALGAAGSGFLAFAGAMAKSLFSAMPWIIALTAISYLMSELAVWAAGGKSIFNGILTIGEFIEGWKEAADGLYKILQGIANLDFIPLKNAVKSIKEDFDAIYKAMSRDALAGLSSSSNPLAIAFTRVVADPTALSQHDRDLDRAGAAGMTNYKYTFQVNGAENPEAVALAISRKMEEMDAKRAAQLKARTKN